MADPFAIIGLLDTVVGWSIQIYGFLSAVSDAPGEIGSLLTELHTLQGIFPLVRDTALKVSESSILASNSQWLPALRGTLEECRSEFKVLLTFVVGSKQDKYIHSWERLYRKASWVLNKDALQESTSRLERYKTSLTLILQVSSQQIGIAISLQLQSLDSRVLNVGPKLDSQVLELRSIFQQSVADIQRQVQRFMTVTGNLEHNNQERLRDLHGSMAEPLQSLPEVTRAGPASPGTVDPSQITTVGSAELPTEASADLISKAWRLLLEQSPDDVRSLPVVRSMPDVRNMTDITNLLSHKFQNAINRRWRFSVGGRTVMVSAIAKVIVGRSMSSSWEMIADALREVAETTVICQREYELYPDASLRDKLVRLYVEVLNLLIRSLQWFQRPYSRRMISRAASREPWPGFSRHISELRKGSNDVLKEVEYLDRRETRIASTRLRFMEKDQRRILLAVEEQKKIMSNLQQQQQILDIVRDQQEVLQSIQNLLIQLRPAGSSDTLGTLPGSPEDAVGST